MDRFIAFVKFSAPAVLRALRVVLGVVGIASLAVSAELAINGVISPWIPVIGISAIGFGIGIAVLWRNFVEHEQRVAQRVANKLCDENDYSILNDAEMQKIMSYNKPTKYPPYGKFF